MRAPARTPCGIGARPGLRRAPPTPRACGRRRCDELHGDGIMRRSVSERHARGFAPPGLLGVLHATFIPSASSSLRGATSPLILSPEPGPAHSWARSWPCQLGARIASIAASHGALPWRNVSAVMQRAAKDVHGAWAKAWAGPYGLPDAAGSVALGQRAMLGARVGCQASATCNGSALGRAHGPLCQHAGLAWRSWPVPERVLGGIGKWIGDVRPDGGFLRVGRRGARKRHVWPSWPIDCSAPTPHL